MIAPTERFRRFTYDELIARDKVNLDITWLKDASLEVVDSLLPPEEIARQTVDDLQMALTELATIADALEQARRSRPLMSARRVRRALPGRCIAEAVWSGVAALVIWLCGRTEAT